MPLNLQIFVTSIGIQVLAVDTSLNTTMTVQMVAVSSLPLEDVVVTVTDLVQVTNANTSA